MDQKRLLKQMVELCQAGFNNSFKANALLQDQFESVAKTIMDQAPWLPPQGRKALEDWVLAFKTGRDAFKKSVDDSYRKVEAFFTE